MPSKKPRLQIILSEVYYNKFKKLCDLHNSSESKMGQSIIENYIEEFEIQNGPLTDQETPAQIQYKRWSRIVEEKNRQENLKKAEVKEKIVQIDN